MRGRLRSAALAAVLLLSLNAGATTASEEQDLYLNAMRLMNEGRHAAAREALEQLIMVEPQHAGAWLDLAITQCALGQTLAAERLFREIEVRFAPSAGILEVINAHRRQGCRPWEAKSHRALAIVRGHDSNVNQGASNPVFATGSGPDRIEHLLTDDYLPQGDSYTQASLDYSRELNPAGGIALAQLRTRHHDSLTGQDTNALLLGLDQPLKLGRLNARGLATASAVSLGGVLYQRQAQLQVRVTPKLPLPDNYELVLATSLSHASYLRRVHFDANTGEASALLNYEGTRMRLQAALGALYDRGEAGRPGGNRHGWYHSALWQRRLGEHTIGEMGWTRQDWHGQLLYAPGLIDTVRAQSTRQLRTALTRELGRQQSVQLEYRYVQNRENISLFQYNSQVLQLSWRWFGW